MGLGWIDLNTLVLIYSVMQMALLVTVIMLNRTYRKKYIRSFGVGTFFMCFAGAVLISENELYRDVLYLAVFLAMLFASFFYFKSVAEIIKTSNKKRNALRQLVFEGIAVCFIISGLILALRRMSGIENESLEAVFLLTVLLGFILTIPRAIHIILSSVGELEGRVFELNQQVDFYAYSDYMTKVPNSRVLMDQLEKELERSQRYRRPFSVALLNIDDFKRINMMYGHLYGDEVLRKFAEKGVGTVRGVDLFGRFEGDTFAVLFPETMAKDAETVIKRLMIEVQLMKWKNEEMTLRFSTGILEVGEENASQDARVLLDKISLSLRQAKSSGKNQVIICE